jgi:Peptidase_C39 like family
MEIVLSYDRNIVGQETGYNCGPASAQVALSCRGLYVPESTLARECGTDSGGTDYVGLIERCLNDRLPERPYRSVYSEQYPTAEKKEKFWREGVLPSIQARYAIVMNWVVPANNRPVGIKGTNSPNYGNKTTYHYVTCVGYDDNSAQRAIAVADSGFQPPFYWITFDQCCTLIPPKGFCYSTIQPPEENDMANVPQEQWDALVRDVAYIKGQLGPWPQLGQNTSGEDLTLIDATASIKKTVEGTPPLSRLETEA